MKMLNEPTLEKLRGLRLGALADAWLEQQGNPDVQALGFDERLAMMVDAEWLDRQNKKLTRHLREAKLRITQAAVEDIAYPAKRKLEKSVIRQLATCNWIEAHQNIIITGKTGVGKTYVACALAQQACRKGYRAIYRRVPRLFDELALVHADGTYSRFLAKLAKVDVLILDDWGLVPVGDSERRDLLEIVEDRYGNRSTILTTQLPSRSWHDHVGDPTIADAICDRLLHNAHELKLNGDSRRKDSETPS
jgi:DNA replication protein DnaC